MRVIDSGDSLTKPGRKFTYTEQDFIEAYMGKDYARTPNLDVEQNQIFGYHEAMKYKFPIDKYMMTPIFEAQQKKLQDSIDWDAMATGKNNTPYSDLIGSINMDEHEPTMDQEHPTDPNRTLYKDSEQRVNKYFAKRERQGKETFITHEIANIKKEIRDEYFPKRKKETEVKVDSVEAIEEVTDTK